MESSHTSTHLIKPLVIKNYGNSFFRDYLFSYMIVFEYVKETVSGRIIIILKSSISSIYFDLQRRSYDFLSPLYNHVM